MENQSANQSPILQILIPEKLIWYQGNPVNATENEFSEFISSLPDEISNSKDRLQFFTYFNENRYKAEKVKTFYDFKIKKERSTVYDPEFSLENAIFLLEKCKEFYEKIRIQQLVDTKEKLKENIQEQLKYRIISLRKYRDTLLRDSDWTQIADIPFSDIDKENWKKYRQKLRDLPDDPSWNYSTSYNTLFPIDPSTYKLRYPNYEVEYLSTPDQFENQKANKIRQNIISTIESFNLPSVKISDFTQMEYVNLIGEINKILSKIDPELKVNVALEVDENVKELDSEVRIAYQFSGMSPEVTKMIENNLMESNKYSEEEAQLLVETLKELDILQ